MSITVEFTDDAARALNDAMRDRENAIVASLPEGGDVLLTGEPAMNNDFNDAISFMVRCDTQAEIDRYWNAIREAGGTPQACGWITDRFGVRWQIVPSMLDDWMADPDPAKAKRTAEEMLNHIKFDIAKLKAAHDGR